MHRRGSDSHNGPGKLSSIFEKLTLGWKDKDKEKERPSSSTEVHSRKSSNPELFVGGFRKEHGAGNISRPQAATATPEGYNSSRPTPLRMPEPFGAPPPPPQKLPVAPPPGGQLYMPEPTHFSLGGVSRTSQMAMDLYGDGKLLPNLPVPPSLPPRPHSDPPPRRDSVLSERRQSTPTTTRPPRPSLGSPATPRKNQDALSVPDPSPRGRAKSSPSSIAGAVTCSGTTKSGEPCKNTVKRPTALGRVDSDADKDIERYCHLHIKEVLKPSGFQSSVANEWVTYDDWIPEYLQEDTRAALRHEMNKPATSSDRDGYIYTFEIRDNSTPDAVHLKVGRTVNLVKRMDQWSKQCESKEQVLRGFWPGDGSADPSNLMKGRIKAGNPGKYCYRLERLVHLELADLMQNKPYLESGFPSQDTAPDRNPSPIERRKCPDCGKTHKEIFTFERFSEGKNKGKEYQVIVEVVVEKWGRYVEKYVDGPIGS